MIALGLLLLLFFVLDSSFVLVFLFSLLSLLLSLLLLLCGFCLGRSQVRYFQHSER